MRLLRRFRPRRQRPVILMYHRIATPRRDPWALSVCPDRFREHLAVLRERRTPMAMTALVRALDQGDVPADAVAVTFDDGYLDNLAIAKPLLEAAGVPATIYLATGWIGSCQPFWWDELEAMLFRPELARLSITVAGERVAIELPRETKLEPYGWRFGKRARTARQKAYVRLWTDLYKMTPGERAAVMDELRRTIPPEMLNPEALPMDAAQAARLASPLVAIGAHGVTHAAMTTLPPDARRAEIEESGHDAARLTNAPVEGFAYPHGDHDRQTRAMVREAGYCYACTTYAAAIDPARYDRFELPRLMVENWTAEELIARMEALPA